MIWPGVNRPPPIGSELEILPGFEGARLTRGEFCEPDGVMSGVRGPETIVSAFESADSSTSVASLPESSVCPQDEQNLPVGDTYTPHEEQNMRAEFYHCRRRDEPGSSFQPDCIREQ